MLSVWDGSQVRAGQTHSHSSEMINETCFRGSGGVWAQDSRMFCVFIYILNGHLFFFLKLEYNCFPMLCSFLLYKEVNQPRAQ